MRAKLIYLLHRIFSVGIGLYFFIQSATGEIIRYRATGSGKAEAFKMYIFSYNLIVVVWH